MAEARAGGAIHTGGDWRVGRASCVVSDTSDKAGIVPGGDDVAYYGGMLICESIVSNNEPIVSAAPDMFKALLAVKQKLHFIGTPGEKVCKVTGKSDWSEEIKLIEAALTKAVTRVRGEIAPVVTPVDVGKGWRAIGDDEVFVAGDEFNDNSNGATPLWLNVDVCLGKRKQDSALSRCVCRRKDDPDVIDASFDVVPDEVTGQPKPPLGLMPRGKWLENRRDDIYDAIARYRAAGKDISRDWLNELLELDNGMRPF